MSGRVLSGGSASRRWWNSAASWLRLFAFNTETVHVIHEQAPIFAPLLLIGAVNFAVALLMRPILHRAMASEPRGVVVFLEVTVWTAAILFPVLVVVRTTALAAVAWSVGVLVNRSPRLKTLISLFLFGEILLLIPAVLNVAVLYLRGLHALREPADLVVRWGIDLVIQSPSPIFQAVVQSTTVFHVIWVVFLCLALPSVAEFSRRMAVLVAGCVWTMVVLLNVIRTSVLY